MDPIAILFYLVFAVAKTIPRPSWPDESSIGINAGISPGKSGFSGFYSNGNNQWNLGVLYSIGSEIMGYTNVHTGLTYNRTLTDWGLYAAGGLNVTYIIEEGDDRYEINPLIPSSPWEPEVPAFDGAAWRSHGIANPEVVFSLGNAQWFGNRKQFGIHADLGGALPFGYGVSHSFYPVLGAGVSYRFKIN